jgi:hypothetical protein
MEDQQQRYERARARVQAIKGFYIHASVFVMVNIGLFVIIVRLRAGSRAGYGGFTGRFWAGASAWEHTPLACSASVGAVLLVRNGRNARPGR